MRENTIKTNNRNIKADVIRGFAIITVILGHCIQNGFGWWYFIGGGYWENKLYQLLGCFALFQVAAPETAMQSAP